MKYINLGLPSGTLWADTNEEGLYTFAEAAVKYGDSLPTKEQFEELMNQCEWKWNNNGYKVTGPNGNSIVLSAAGFLNCFEKVNIIGSDNYGFYWSSTPDDSDYTLALNFNLGGLYIGNYYRCYGFSVRLIK